MKLEIRNKMYLEYIFFCIVITLMIITFSLFSPNTHYPNVSTFLLAILLFPYYIYIKIYIYIYLTNITVIISLDILEEKYA